MTAIASATRKQQFQLRAISYILPAATIMLMIYFSVSTRSFLSIGNMLAVATQNSSVFIVAGVAGILLIAGYADLSVGSNMAVSGVVAGLMFNSLGVFAGVVGGLLVGILIGVINGYLIGYLDFSLIIVTLGLLATGRGLALFLAPASVYNFPAVVGEFGSATIGGISYLVIIATIITIICMVLMNKLPFGRHVIAIGNNKRAAYLSGVRVKPIIMSMYVATGAASGLAGVLEVARLNSAPSATLGAGFEVTVLTAILLGGIPFAGGRGAIWRILVGAWLIAALQNGLTLMNIGVQASGIITGAVLVGAAGLEAIRWKIRKGS